MLSDLFLSCTLAPVPKGEIASSSVIKEADGKWTTSSFYLDSSGRSSLSLPLRMTFASQDVLQQFLDTSCFDPMPKIPGAQEDSERSISKNENGPAIGIEAKVTLTFGTGEAIVATVERVSILRTQCEGPSVVFYTEIIVRVSRGQGSTFPPAEASKVKTILEVNAVFSEIKLDSLISPKFSLYLSGLTTLASATMTRRVVQTKLTPFTLNAALTNAFSISVRSIKGPLMGKTFLALSIRHSDTHGQPVTITNIALHPGHSQQKRDDGSHVFYDVSNASKVDRSLPVVDMSKSVKWGYAARSDPHLPLTLHPHEAVSTIIEVDATDDQQCRICVCPISVTATIGDRGSSSHQSSAVAGATAEWMTSRAAVEPADAFRVDMKLDESEGQLGTPLSVSMAICNLSSEARDLILAMAKEESEHSGQDSSQEVAISVVDGKKLIVEGVLPSAKGRMDQPLLGIDVGLLIGELKAHASVTVELRFIPLKEGPISIPPFHLVDRKSGKTFNCIHNLRIVGRKQ